MLKCNLDVLKHRSNACFSRLQHVISVCEPPDNSAPPTQCRTHAARRFPVFAGLQQHTHTHKAARQTSAPTAVKAAQDNAARMLPPRT